jgi:asparagine synthase (glutamine-hydrolysing)
MCGIAGISNWSKKEITFSQLAAMAKAQMHRGPDGHGYAIWGHNRKFNWPLAWRGPNAVSPDLAVDSVRVGVAHNWLAIQDTRTVAQQPMSDRAQRYWIVFNGEIYNFIELREDLVAEGFTFDTSSDTEVLLALWNKLGPKALDILRGMFAFILYDSHEDVLWTARDRFGIKPLYYAMLPADGGVILASEFRGIHGSGLVPRVWKELAVKAFLVAGVNNPGSVTTFFEGVSELPPGCYLRISPGNVVMNRYYQLPAIERPTLGGEDLADLRNLFCDVIRIHLRSVREVGTCMSGGLDSTNIASAIHEVLGKDVTNFKAFTLGSRGNLDFDLAQQASKMLGFQHFTMNPPRIIELPDLADMIVACETPNHTWGPINQYLLLRYIHTKHGLPVLLDGQGGDEVFSGYAWFFPVLEQFIRDVFGVEEAISLRDSHFGKLPFPLPLLQSFHEIFFCRRKWIESFNGGAMASLGLSMEEVMEWEPVKYYLNDELDWSDFREREFYRRELQFLLRQEDRLAMWFSIESRVPFLDHIFVEHVNRLDPRFLIYDGYLKYPLRVLFPELPNEIRFNAAKKGFWEDYSSIPYFEYIARYALRQSEGLSKLVRNRKACDNLSGGALWRFIQMALLLDAGSAEEGRAWVNDILKRAPVGALTLYPWLRRLQRRALSVFGR